MVLASWRFRWGSPTETDAAFTETMGLPSKMPDSGWHRLIHGDDLTGVLMDWNAAYHRRRPVILKFRMLDAWDECRWMISIGRPDPSGDGYAGFFLIGEPVPVFAMN